MLFVVCSWSFINQIYSNADRYSYDISKIANDVGGGGGWLNVGLFLFRHLLVLVAGNVAKHLINCLCV